MRVQPRKDLLCVKVFIFGDLCGPVCIVLLVQFEASEYQLVACCEMVGFGCGITS